jgi:hypothetical protein
MVSIEKTHFKGLLDLCQNDGGRRLQETIVNTPSQNIPILKEKIRIFVVSQVICVFSYSLPPPLAPLVCFRGGLTDYEQIFTRH